MEYERKQELKIFKNNIQYYFYKLLRMEDFFLKKQEIIDSQIKDLEDKKYTRLCLIDFIDNGGVCTVDRYGIKLVIRKDIEPGGYREKASYLTKLANIYEHINECIDKISIRYAPANIVVSISGHELITIIIDNLDGREESILAAKRREDDRKTRSSSGYGGYSRGLGSGFGGIRSY